MPDRHHKQQQVWISRDVYDLIVELRDRLADRKEPPNQHKLLDAGIGQYCRPYLRRLKAKVKAGKE